MTVILKTAVQKRFRRCPLCDGADHEIFHRMTYSFLRDKLKNEEALLNFIFEKPQDAIDLVICRSCGMVYTRNQYDLSDIREMMGIPRDAPLTTEAFKKQHQGSGTERYLISLHIVQNLVRLLASHSFQRIRFLDFGGGYVGFHARLANMVGCAECFVYDPIIEEAKHDRITFCNRMEEVYANGPYDAVVCNEVLEHAMNPRETIRDIFRLLRPGGYAFFAVPLLRYDRLERHRREVETGVGEAAKIVHINHINYFSIERLARLIQETGFDLLPIQLDPMLYKYPHFSRFNGLLRIAVKMRFLGFVFFVKLRWFPSFSRYFVSQFFVRKPTSSRGRKR